MFALDSDGLVDDDVGVGWDAWLTAYIALCVGWGAAVGYGEQGRVSDAIGQGFLHGVGFVFVPFAVFWHFWQKWREAEASRRALYPQRDDRDTGDS